MLRECIILPLPLPPAYAGRQDQPEMRDWSFSVFSHMHSTLLIYVAFQIPGNMSDLFKDL